MSRPNAIGVGVLILAVVTLTGLTACQVKPTRVTETRTREFDLVVSKSSKPLALTDATVVLDARSAFDYGLSRIVGSHHFPYENLLESASSGELIKDRRKLAQRLSLLGLTPETPVVVVGKGPEGQGEEGQLAWTLLYLGFRDVQTATVEMFRKNLTQLPTPLAKNAELFALETRDRLVMEKKEFQKWASSPKDRPASHVWLVDVRSEKEYFNKAPGVKSHPDIGALHVEWKQFYTPEGRPDPSLRKKLLALGIQESDRIILLSNHGRRSAAAAYALLSLGFERVENFKGGWDSL